LLPSGVVQSKKVLIAAGVSVNPSVLCKEINSFKQQGIKVDLVIDARAQLIMPYHCFFEACKEEALKNEKIGTTLRGIGPCYADRALRTGIRFADLLDGSFEKKARQGFEFYSMLGEKVFGKKINFSFNEMIQELKNCAEQLKTFVGDVSLELNTCLNQNKIVLLEGAQGTWLDNDFGTYPFVTSSHPIAGGACTGIGLSPKKINKIVGVLKAYTTRVGSGPMPSEIFGEKAELLRLKGNEFGTTTNRPRRVGWLDLVLVKYSNLLNHFDELALTKIDVLSDFGDLKIVVAYELNGKTLELPPLDLNSLKECKPVFKEFKGFSLSEKEKNLALKEGFNALPKEMKDYIEFIESFLKIPIKIVSIGMNREDTITR
jgi:adenylosuccinate synthase